MQLKAIFWPFKMIFWPFFIIFSPVQWSHRTKANELIHNKKNQNGSYPCSRCGTRATAVTLVTIRTIVSLRRHISPCGLAHRGVLRTIAVSRLHLGPDTRAHRRRPSTSLTADCTMTIASHSHCQYK